MNSSCSMPSGLCRLEPCRSTGFPLASARAWHDVATASALLRRSLSTAVAGHLQRRIDEAPGSRDTDAAVSILLEN
jgi:hypothetical protein